ncbi:MAG: histidinol-phosphatase HisJ family protein [Clostridiaceae bacterium]|nr:histidinol-phosphatase HisJ family protein [Clostridiaceae bacterium]
METQISKDEPQRTPANEPQIPHNTRTLPKFTTVPTETCDDVTLYRSPQYPISGIVDCHNHTRHFSLDGRYKLVDLREEGRALGLKGIAITEHIDKGLIDGIYLPGNKNLYSQPLYGEWYFDIYTYIRFIREMRAKYNRPEFLAAGEDPDAPPPYPELLFGLELGYTSDLAVEYDELITRFSSQLDVVIGSIHCVDNVDIYSERSAYEKGKSFIFGRYLELIIEMLEKQQKFDIVGHYDYVARYSFYEDKRFLYSEFSDLFDHMFRLMIEQNKCLEINTRSYYQMSRRNNYFVYPDPEVLIRYYEMGGRRICFSSDAHSPGEIGLGAQFIIRLIRACGFENLTWYKQRKERFTSITDVPPLTEVPRWGSFSL